MRLVADRRPRDRASACDGAASSHHLDPATLLALASELYGAAPRTYLISVRGNSSRSARSSPRTCGPVVPLAVEAALRLAGSLADA